MKQPVSYIIRQKGGIPLFISSIMFHCRNSISNSKEHKASTLHKKFHFDSVWLEDHLTTKGPGIQDFCSVIAWNTYYLFFDKTVSSRYIYAPWTGKRDFSTWKSVSGLKGSKPRTWNSLSCG